MDCWFWKFPVHWSTHGKVFLGKFLNSKRNTVGEVESLMFWECPQDFKVSFVASNHIFTRIYGKLCNQPKKSATSQSAAFNHHVGAWLMLSQSKSQTNKVLEGQKKSPGKQKIRVKKQSLVWTQIKFKQKRGRSKELSLTAEMNERRDVKNVKLNWKRQIGLRKWRKTKINSGKSFALLSTRVMDKNKILVSV